MQVVALATTKYRMARLPNEECCVGISERVIRELPPYWQMCGGHQNYTTLHGIEGRMRSVGKGVVSDP